MTPGQLVARAIVGGIVLVPWMHTGGTLGELGVCIVLAVAVACCMPDAWKDDG